MMHLLSTLNYIPAFIAGLVLMFLAVKIVLLPVCEFITYVRDRTTEVAIYPLTVFLGFPAISVFAAAVIYTFSMFLYMVGGVH
ncbi:hypothetical protein ACSSUQ_004233 [Yersinia enterocolitica]